MTQNIFLKKKFGGYDAWNEPSIQSRVSQLRCHLYQQAFQ